ncbi:MAG TPA: hypothetical protein VJW20_07275 [Candidatus Angelobacter sp.]|nr:hypothetical protein [Candidatus Angelobacter sp.]
MNFSGYIPLRRGLISHIQDGRLTNNEALTFIVLLMLADSSTGSYTINAPSLRAYLPELSYDAAKRALLALEEKRYIFRDIKPFSTRVYRFWIGNYRPTTGQYRALQTDISKALDTRDVNDITYINPALEGALGGAPEGALEGAPNNKKEKEKEKKENPLPGVCASLSDSVCDSMNQSRQRTKRSAEGPACALHDATHDATHTMHHDMHHAATHDMHHANDTPRPPKKLAAPEDLGMSWCEREKAYRDAESGRLLGWPEFQDRFSQGATA